MFLDLVRHSNLEHNNRPFLDRTQSRIFLDFLFKHEKYVAFNYEASRSSLRWALSIGLRVTAVSFFGDFRESYITKQERKNKINYFMRHLNAPLSRYG